MTFIRKSVVLVETHLTLHEGLLALRLLQNVPSTNLPEHLEEDPVLKWMYSELDLLQEALLAICDLEYDFLTIFRLYHLLRIVSSRAWISGASNFSNSSNSTTRMSTFKISPRTMYIRSIIWAKLSSLIDEDVTGL